MIRIGLIVLMLLAVLLLVPSGAIVASAEILEIPVDVNEKTLTAPWPDCYVSDMEYEDPSISVKIEKGRAFDTNYLVARVRIATPGQLRTTMEGSYRNPTTIAATSMARRVKAVLAINGDYFSNRLGVGYVARQGVVYRNAADKTESKSGLRFDVLLIDDKGDFHILPQATGADIEAFEGTVINGFSFGPGLVIDGERKSGFADMNNGAFVAAQRMCVAQTGELEYMCICSEGPEDQGSKGMTLEQFAQVVGGFEEIQNAYNLDGGSCAWMVFKKGDKQYEKINSPLNPKRRPISDIIYFCTAFVP